MPPRRSTAREASSWVGHHGLVDAPILLPELPSEVPFGFLGRLLPTTLAAELRLQLHRIPSGRALEILDRAHAVASVELATEGGTDRARPAQLEREVETSEGLARRVAAREQELWRVGLSLHALGSSPRTAERGRSELLRRLRPEGFRPYVPFYEAGPVASPPDLNGTEPRPAGYWHTLHTDGVAAFFPFLDETVAEPGGVLTGLLLDDASPVFLNRWSHASHSWGVFGATGSGKTFFTALTALRSLWMHPELELIFLDPLGEFTGLARALGGNVVRATDGVDGQWNPLDPDTAGGDRAEKAGRVAVIVRALFPSLRDEEAATLDAALRRLYDRGPVAPVFSDLVAEVETAPGDNARLRSLLEVFVTGSLRHLDRPTEVAWSAGPTAVSLVGVPESQLAFHLTYLLDAVVGHLRARKAPSLVVVDEAHLLARDPGTAAYLDRMVRHLRHYSAGVVLVSQNPDDFLGSETGRSLLRNLRATVLLRLPQVSGATREFFGLTAAEAEWLPKARLPREAGYSEALLRSGASHLPVALVASTPEFEFLTQALRGADQSSEAPPRLPVED